MNHGDHTPDDPQDPKEAGSDPQDPKEAGGHGKHGILMMIACCVPMVVVFVLIGLKVI